MRRCTDICRCAGVCRCIGVRRCAGVRRCEECFLRRSNPGFDFYKKATFDKSRSSSLRGVLFTTNACATTNARATTNFLQLPLKILPHHRLPIQIPRKTLDIIMPSTMQTRQRRMLNRRIQINQHRLLMCTN